MAEKEVTVKILCADVPQALSGLEDARRFLAERGGLVNGGESYPERGIRIWVNPAPKRKEVG